MSKTESQLTLFAVDFPAKISASPGRELESKKVRAAAYGHIAPVCLGKFDQNSPSLKTSQTCLTESGEIGLSEFSGIFPRSGTMQSGTVFQHPNLAHTITEIGYGLLPTPNARDGKDLSRTTGFLAARKLPHTISSDGVTASRLRLDIDSKCLRAEHGVPVKPYRYSLKQCGNAVYPPITEMIGRAIMESSK